MPNSNLFLFERIIKKGVFEIASLQGNCWLKIFYQKYDSSDLFTDEKEAKYIISRNKYSLLANITDNYKIDNQYEFIISYPEYEEYFRWQQSIFPLNEIENINTEVNGFNLISNTSIGYNFGGLVKTNISDESNRTNCLLDGNPGSSTYFFCIAAYKNGSPYWISNGFPSFVWNVNKKASLVSLWLRMPYPISLLLLTCKIPKNSKLVLNSMLYVSISQT